MSNMPFRYRCALKALREFRKALGPVLSSPRLTARGFLCQQHNFYAESHLPRLPQAPRTKVAHNAGEYINIRPWDAIHVVYLRDCCTCPRCVDPSSKQKTFQTTDIPRDIRSKSLKISPDDGTVEIVWENDIPGFEEGHKSVFQREFFEIHSTAYTLHKSRYENGKPTLWNKKTISRELEYVDFDEYMNTDIGLYSAVRQVSRSSKSFEHVLILVCTVAQIWFTSCPRCPSI